MSNLRKPSKATTRTKSSTKLKLLAACHSNSHESLLEAIPVIKPLLSMDLKKEYNRYCKLYSAEPLEFVAAPLEQATLCQGGPSGGGIGGVAVDLKGRGLRGVDCIALGKILASNVTIQQMNLSDCLLLPQGFQALLDGISKNVHLEILELRGNNIQCANMLEPLGSLMKVNSKLKRLILEWNQIGSNKEAFQAFCDGLSINSGLELLDLRNNQIADECAIELASALKHNKVMKDIDLRWNAIGVKGARAFYDLLNVNPVLSQVQLGGNYVPEEIVQHIEQILKQRSAQEEIVKDFSTRTTILTRQLQKTEEEYQSEIKNIMSIFDAEEKEYRRIIEENQNQINTLSQERQEEMAKVSSLQKEITTLRASLEEMSDGEAALKKRMVDKDARVTEVESSYKSQIASLESNFEKKVKELQSLVDATSQENSQLSVKLKTTEAELQGKLSEVKQLKDTISALNRASEQLQQQFDERLRQAKESWAGFQTEVESAERKEIQRLEQQMTEMNTSLMEHLRLLENKKADAEEEVRRLKIILVTSKSETEEAVAKVRGSLAEEHNAAVKTHLEQISNLRQDNERLELETNKLEGQVHKLEMENGKLARQVEHFKQQLGQANQDLSEAHASSQTAMSRTRNELKDTTERLGKEEEANRLLRSQLHELQQKVATLSVKVTKQAQEKQADTEFWKLQIQRREEELTRLKSEDMRRAALLHEAFSVYMRSTAAATGLPIPVPCSQDSNNLVSKCQKERENSGVQEAPENPSQK